MSRTKKEQLDMACYNLRAVMLNPYAVARYLARSKQVEQTWKDLAKKKRVNYTH